MALRSLILTLCTCIAKEKRCILDEVQVKVHELFQCFHARTLCSLPSHVTCNTVSTTNVDWRLYCIRCAVPHSSLRHLGRTGVLCKREKNAVQGLASALRSRYCIFKSENSARRSPFTRTIAVAPAVITRTFSLEVVRGCQSARQ